MWFTVLLLLRTDESHNLYTRFTDLPFPASSLQQLCTQQRDMETPLPCKIHLPGTTNDKALQLHLQGLWWCSLHQLRTMILDFGMATYDPCFSVVFDPLCHECTPQCMPRDVTHCWKPCILRLVDH